ncbi:Pentatricopeptide repeat-containing protein [Hordeum vulgare]|nr:Pentatricopeptide repeat-containing protein [Hordeum vulgare]
MRLAAAAGVLRPTAALLFHSRSRPHRLLPSPRRSSLPFARRRRHSYSSSTATALDDPPPPPSPDAPTPTGQGGDTKAARRRRARESPEGLLKHRLDMCSRDADLATALQLYEAAVDPATAVPLALHHYNCLLYLCSNSGDADAARRGFEIFAAMEAQGVEPNEATLTSLARLAAAVRDPAMAFSVVRRMAAAGIPPRLRSYGPALFAYCDARDANGAAEVEAHMDAGGVVPEETELTALLRVNADIGRADQVYRVLHRTRTLVRQVCQATAQVVEAWFRSDAAAEAGVDKWDARKVREGVVKGGGGWHGQGWLGKGQWDVGQSEMDKDGRCQRCGEKLVCIDIDPSETETFAKSLAELACNREVRDDFVRFQDWLHRHGPFDAVIDAANVGLYKSKAFSFSQVNSVVNGIQRVTKSKKLPLIVLHRSRVNCGPAKTPQNQKLIESWRNAGALYSTPPGSNDDWNLKPGAGTCRRQPATTSRARGSGSAPPGKLRRDRLLRLPRLARPAKLWRDRLLLRPKLAPLAKLRRDRLLRCLKLVPLGKLRRDRLLRLPRLAPPAKLWRDRLLRRLKLMPVAKLWIDRHLRCPKLAPPGKLQGDCLHRHPKLLPLTKMRRDRLLHQKQARGTTSHRRRKARSFAGRLPEQQQQQESAAGCHGEQELAVDARFPIMASRSAALCFSAAVTTTTATGGSGRGRSRRRVLVVCCDGGRRSDLLSSSLAAKVLGAPTTFDAAKLTVQHAGAGESFPRAYTLSHCDFTANLTLAVSETITSEQLRRWGWRRDDVFAEWKEMTCTGGPGGGEMTLHLHCHVSGPNPLQELAAGFRYYVFSKELPLVLKAVVHGDAALFAARPELMDARVWVHFHSSTRKYNRIECWGALRDATKRNLLDGGLVDELQSEITERRRTWNIFNALFSFLL